MPIKEYKTVRANSFTATNRWYVASYARQHLWEHHQEQSSKDSYPAKESTSLAWPDSVFKRKGLSLT